MQKSTDNSYRPEIQGIRALAVLLVVLYHSDFVFPSGFVGVDVFFVISGYVITQSLLRELEKSESINLIAFYARRVRRLLPGLAVMLTVVLFLSTWFSTISSRVQTVRTGLFATFSLSNLFLFRFRPDGYFVVSEKSNALLHTWSLSIEEQFYLIFPVIMVFLVFLGIRANMNLVKLLFSGFLFFSVASILLSSIISVFGVSVTNSSLSRIFGTTDLDSRFAFYMPITRAWEFLAGALIAFIPHRSVHRIGFRWLGSLGLVLIFVSSFVLANLNSFPGYVALLPVCGASLLIVATGSSGFVGRILSNRYAVWLGDRSYGWYLWHWPVIQFVKPFWPSNYLASLTAAVVALLPAALTYRYVESRFRNDVKWRRPRSMAFLLVVSLLIPVIAAMSSKSRMPELGPHFDATRGCEYGNLEKILNGGDCVLPVANSVGKAVLLGDSHAGHLTEAFVAASHEIGLTAVLAVNGNNPFLFKPWDFEATRNSYPYAVLDLIKTMNVDVVVIAQSGYNQNAPEGIRWSDEFIPVLKFLEKAKIPVVVVAASVNVGVYPQACSVIQVYVRSCDADVILNANELETGRGYRIGEELYAVGQVSNAIIMDTFPILCPEINCRVRREGKWWWRDEAHISITASREITPLMKTSLLSAIEIYK